MILKPIRLGMLCVGATLLLTVYSEASPKDVAIDFAKALFAANMEKVKSLSSNSFFQDGITDLVNRCYSEEANRLEEEAQGLLRDIKNSKTAEKLSKEELKNLPDLNTIGMDLFKKVKRDTSKLIDTYGAKRRIPREKSMAMENAIITDGEHQINQALITILAALKINHKPLTVRVLSKFIAHSMVGQATRNRVYYSHYEAALDVLKQDHYTISKTCIAQKTLYGFIDHITPIEVIEESPDRQTVRLELIDTKDHSTKVAIEVEMINKQWKIAGFTGGVI